jgi:MFS family permease
MTSLGMVVGQCPILVLSLKDILIRFGSGGAMSGFVADLWGRRAAMLAGATISAVGVAVEYIAATPEVLLVGKIVCCYYHSYQFSGLKTN